MSLEENKSIYKNQTKQGLYPCFFPNPGWNLRKVKEPVVTLRTQNPVTLRSILSRQIAIFGFLAVFLSQTVIGGAIGSAQITLDDVIEKNIAASGGVEKWEAVRSIKMEGTYVNFSDPTPFVIWRQRPDLYRFDSNRIKQNIITAYDGEQTWWVNPLFGPANAKPVTIPSQNNLDKVTLRERFFEPVFWNYDQRGHQVELAGLENFDDRDCYKLVVALADSTVEAWFIDAESFLIAGMTGDTYDFGFKVSGETFFSDYRDVAGVQMPFLIESEYGTRYRSMEIESIQINSGVEPGIFVRPDSSTWKAR
jgi:outer membrane lipoprotein-sorting protein